MSQGEIDLTKRISVVIITRNRAKSLVRTLQHLRQLPEKFPILVVDNHSTDGTVTLIKKYYPEVTLLPLSKNHYAIGRNLGVQCTTTPYVAFCDDDSWWEPGALVKAVTYFEQYPDLGLIAGKIVVNNQRMLDPISALQSISPLTPYTRMPGPAILGFLGCGIMVRKKAFMAVQGYNRTSYFSGEEELLGIDLAAAGWGLTYCEDIVGCHYPAPRTNVAQRQRLSARNQVQVAVMRRPWRKVAYVLVKLARRSFKDWHVVAGLFMGIVQVPLILRYRTVVPWWIEQQITLLEAQNEDLAVQARQKQREFAHEMQLESA